MWATFFFREYIVEFDMRNQNAPVIGIAPLNKHYSPVRDKQLDYAGLKANNDPSSTKLILKKGHDKAWRQPQHTTMLMEIDRIPVVNKQGTQYFMDVKIGTPYQPFTVIFDTGSNVFGVFTYRNSLPANIKSQLLQAPSVKVRTDPENILMLTNKPKRQAPAHVPESKEGMAISLAMASVDAGGHAEVERQTSAMSFGVGLLLLAIVANVLAGVHYVSRSSRTLQVVDSGSPARAYVQLPRGSQYAAVSPAPVV